MYLMPKNAIVPINIGRYLMTEIDFKKQILLFDKLVIESGCDIMANHIANFLFSNKAITQNFYRLNRQNIEFLQDKGLLEFIQYGKVKFEKYLNTDYELFFLETQSKLRSIQDLMSKYINQKPSLKEWLDIYNAMPSSISRALSIELLLSGHDNYHVLSNTKNDNEYIIGKKEQILNFLLTKIPTPEDKTSWEQIIDFKNDPNTMNKYYALINWVNEVSRGDLSFSEFEDKYQYLHSEYINQYRIHKMKYKQTGLEIAVTAGIDILANGFGINTIQTSLFSLWKSEMNLLEAETKFDGREISYIYRVNQKFK